MDKGTDHMHFYCFQPGFECSPFKKSHKVTMDKGTDAVPRGLVNLTIFQVP